MSNPKRFSYNGAQLKPCIMAKVRHALGVTDKRPINQTKCSQAYWTMTVEALAAHHDITSTEKVSDARAKYAEYIK